MQIETIVAASIGSVGAILAAYIAKHGIKKKEPALVEPKDTDDQSAKAIGILAQLEQNTGLTHWTVNIYDQGTTANDETLQKNLALTYKLEEVLCRGNILIPELMRAIRGEIKAYWFACNITLCHMHDTSSPEFTRAGNKIANAATEAKNTIQEIRDVIYKGSLAQQAGSA